jgi:EF hand
MEQTMKLTYKSTGLGIVAVAVLMLGSAAIADQMGSMGHGAMMGGQVLDLTAMDTDKDGKVSKDEMTAHRAARTAAVDANADGKLSADELAAMHLTAMETAAKNMAARMIEQLDTDADGLLSVAELAARPGPEMMFDRIDANSDGFIDQAEVDAAKAAMMDRGGKMRGGHHGKGDHNGHDGMDMGDN